MTEFRRVLFRSRRTAGCWCPTGRRRAPCPSSSSLSGRTGRSPFAATTLWADAPRHERRKGACNRQNQRRSNPTRLKSGAPCIWVDTSNQCESCGCISCSLSKRKKTLFQPIRPAEMPADIKCDEYHNDHLYRRQNNNRNQITRYQVQA